MGTTIHQKLVRDQIPDIIQRSGASAVVRRLSEEDYREALNQKLLEEVNEFLEDENPEGLADILEVIYAILALKTLSFSALEELRQCKQQKSGGFAQRWFLESVHAD
ncbi:MAG TPA: nucleoside triphosphate pyrophosphohydrolase [Candidatus Limiplasma sp.]|nr:nucleoside triphosphate pyrophosphohydrolase [Candidatus Limiplasma sp.]HRX09926.1 nucleoside triphosphate pyrophosphohydrolase [Candidatus Limiplasma sp.]